MTGPEHYREAERLLTADYRLHDEDDYVWSKFPNPGPGPQEVAMAQVHATLALAAATIDAGYGQLSVNADEAWHEAVSNG